jgi:hypothetical protein
VPKLRPSCDALANESRLPEGALLGDVLDISLCLDAIGPGLSE